MNSGEIGREGGGGGVDRPIEGILGGDSEFLFRGDLQWLTINVGSRPRENECERQRRHAPAGNSVGRVRRNTGRMPCIQRRKSHLGQPDGNWGGRRITTGHVAYDANNQIMQETKEQATAHGPWVPVREEREEPGAVSVNLDGIKQVTVDKDGLISSIELSTGESVQRADPPALKAYLIPLLYPILGFLLPWGSIRLLTWVGGGFVEPRR
jgi:hypothetical protein